MLNALGLAVETEGQAARKQEYLGGKLLSTTMVLAHFYWSVTLYIKKHGGYSFALKIVVVDVGDSPGED